MKGASTTRPELELAVTVPAEVLRMWRLASGALRADADEAVAGDEDAVDVGRLQHHHIGFMSCLRRPRPGPAGDENAMPGSELPGPMRSR